MKIRQPLVSEWVSSVPGRWLCALETYITKAFSGFLSAAWHEVSSSRNFQSMFLDLVSVFFMESIYYYKKLNLLLLKNVSLCSFVRNRLCQAQMMKVWVSRPWECPGLDVWSCLSRPLYPQLLGTAPPLEPQYLGWGFHSLETDFSALLVFCFGHSYSSPRPAVYLDNLGP